MASLATQQPWILSQEPQWARLHAAPFGQRVLASINADKAELAKHEGTQISQPQGYFYAGDDANELDGVCIGHDATGRTIAVKVRSSGARGARLRRGLGECRLLRTFIHPNVVKCLDTFVSSTQHLYLLTPWAEFGDLSTTIVGSTIGGRAVVESDVEKIAGETLSGIAYIQACAFVHGDIKPGHLLLGKTDEAPTSSLPGTRETPRLCSA